MRYLALIFTFCLLFGSLKAEEKLVGTALNVDLYVKNIINEDGHNYGEEYFVVNRNDYGVRVTIRLSDVLNADDRLIPNTIIVEGGAKGMLGQVTQKDMTSASNWKYEWKAEKDCK